MTWKVTCIVFTIKYFVVVINKSDLNGFRKVVIVFLWMVYQYYGYLCSITLFQANISLTGKKKEGQ